MSAEVIHWGAAQLLWTGRDFQLEIPAALDVGPANWLNLNLRDQLEPALQARASVEVRPGRRSQGGWADFGVIVIHPLKQPFPNVGVIHKTLSEAVDQAYAEAEQAGRDANDYVSQIRGLGN
jgi:hypothetical protein